MAGVKRGGKGGETDFGQELGLGFIINESLIRIALWLHDLGFTSVCRLSSWKTLNSPEDGNQFNSTFCSQFRLFALKKIQLSVLFGNNWRALGQWACWNFCMFILLSLKSSKFITHFTGHEGQGAWELFVMASEGKFYSRSHESPLFTVESTKKLTYQTVMRSCYKSGKILNENKLRSPDGRRIRKRSFLSKARSAQKKKRQACLFIIC